MTRIVHLSDLHFGFHRAALTRPLLDCVNAARADLVVVTGDLTHRARAGQYRQAAAFLAGIRTPLLVVPGNHDVPLFNLPVRYLAPWRAFRRAVAPGLMPAAQVGRVRVLGLNSVDPLAVQRGIVRRAELDRVLGGLDPLSLNIVALHHPLEHLAQVDKELALNAGDALARLERGGAHVLLTGHLHVWATGAMLDQTAHRGVLQVQAGTALCGRVTDLQNEFAVLEVEGPRLTIERHVAPMGQAGFQPPLIERFTRRDGVWMAHQPAERPIVPGATETAFSTA